ncbi:hypothetical protein [Massilia sp. S19_KUP03_FR1]|uniref:hypothetical protein n=1 Tax=Massilia sp. S19_KUP03_FR1 TaxID=3025503 RepID=UPI002FCDD987
MMTTTAVPPSPLRSWLTGCLLALLAFGACWIGAVAYWRARDGDPGTGELLFYLFLLPGALLGAALVTRKRLAEPARAPAPAPVHDVAAIPVQNSSAQSLAIRATALRSPHGASVAEVASKLTDKSARPALDATLTDPDGLPLLTARCSGADEPALQDEITAWLSTTDITAPLRDEDWRALILGTQVARELAGHAVLALQEDAKATPALQLVAILPSDWGASQRHAAGMWLQHTVAQAGWPLERIDLGAPDGTDLLDPVPAALLDQLAVRAATGPVTCLLIACASHLGDDTVAAWSASGTLFTATQPQGRTPGEGAIGLLLTNAAQSSGSALLAPLHVGRRDTSADAARAPIPPLLTNLAHAAGDPAALAMIVADTSLRPSRMLELMGFAGSAAPQLDDQQDIVTFGHASGACGAVPALSALALASHYACERSEPVLWLSNDDAFQRVAAVLRPAMAQA